MPLVRYQGLALLTEAILTNPSNYDRKLGEAVSVNVLSEKTLPILINRILFTVPEKTQQQTSYPSTAASGDSMAYLRKGTGGILSVVPMTQRWQLALSIMNSKAVMKGQYRLDEGLWNTVLSSCPCDKSKSQCVSALRVLFLNGRGSVGKKGKMDDNSCSMGSSTPSNR